jgi:peptidoglycan/LPS O-acetylase OafA/YrhL
MNALRRRDVDWLRILAMLTVFLFHCARFFNDEDWHVKNNQLSEGFTFMVNFLVVFMMPLFFVLSGISSYYSLQRRTGKRFIWERFKRLFIPLAFGILVLIPPQVYIERVTHNQFNGSFISFFPHYFEGMYAFGGNFAWMGLHLWYLEVLFVFSLLTAGLLVFMKKHNTSHPGGWLHRMFGHPFSLFLLIVPLFIMEVMANLHPDTIGMRGFGGWSVLTYLVFFLLGYVVATDDRFRGHLEKAWILSLALGIVLMGVRFILIASGLSFPVTVISLLRSANAWCWLAAIMGAGSRYLRSDNRFFHWAGEAVLPFYILHQSVIVVTGYFIRNWLAGVVLKYLFLVSVSLILIILVYELLVKRVNLLRFLFGMKVRRPAGERPAV